MIKYTMDIYSKEPLDVDHIFKAVEAFDCEIPEDVELIAMKSKVVDDEQVPG